MLLGGALTSSLSWSWIFFINVPVGRARARAGAAPGAREPGARSAHRHFDVPGAASITGGLMLLVYAMTRAVQHGWGTSETIGLLAASAALIVAFVVVEARSSAPLLPLRMFRLRTLTGSNIAGLLLGGAVFSQFFLLTLYMQQVLHYSALQTGVAYVALTLAVIVFANVAQALALRVGSGRCCRSGLLLAAAGLVLYARLPVDGHYFWDLFPAFLLSGIGMALAFIPMTIGALAGVRSRRCGHRLGADQHDPADRRCDRRRGGHHDRGHLHEPLPRRASGREPCGRRRADPRLRDRVLRARRRRGARGSPLRARRRVEAAARRRGGAARRGARARGCRMTGRDRTPGSRPSHRQPKEAR